MVLHRTPRGVSRETPKAPLPSTCENQNRAAPPATLCCKTALKGSEWTARYPHSYPQRFPRPSVPAKDDPRWKGTGGETVVLHLHQRGRKPTNTSDKAGCSARLVHDIEPCRACRSFGRTQGHIPGYRQRLSHRRRAGVNKDWCGSGQGSALWTRSTGSRNRASRGTSTICSRRRMANTGDARQVPAWAILGVQQFASVGPPMHEV